MKNERNEKNGSPAGMGGDVVLLDDGLRAWPAPFKIKKKSYIR